MFLILKSQIVVTGVSIVTGLIMIICFKQIHSTFTVLVITISKPSAMLNLMFYLLDANSAIGIIYIVQCFKINILCSCSKFTVLKLKPNAKRRVYKACVGSCAVYVGKYWGVHVENVKIVERTETKTKKQ